MLLVKCSTCNNEEERTRAGKRVSCGDCKRARSLAHYNKTKPPAKERINYDTKINWIFYWDCKKFGLPPVGTFEHAVYVRMRIMFKNKI